MLTNMPNMNWTEKDDAAVQSIIVNILNQEKVFADISNKSPLKSAFKIQNPNEYKLGVFTGVVINLFANYWINEHETGLTSTQIIKLHERIASFNDLIFKELFP
ncbi:MAG: hypothetical protein R3327_05280 [Nitrosopumilaceae archaeon]|nr:hypothetical protein [Nitrosopumilaceae archaeon]